MGNSSYPHWSKYRDNETPAESLALARSETVLNQERGRYITKDDLLNLKIDLETCKDVNEFIATI
jgi:hypothetical protein